MGALYIKDQEVDRLATELALRRGLTKSAAVRLALVNELSGDDAKVPLREIFAALREKHPLPPATGLKADKAFFDELSGDL